MKKGQAILVLIMIFIVSAAVGVGGTWVVKNMGAKGAIAGGGGGTATAVVDEYAPTPTPKTTPTPKATPTPQPTPNDYPSQKSSKPKKVEITVPENEAPSGKQLGGETETIDINIPSAEITLVAVNGPTPNPETRTYSFSASAAGGRGQLTYYLYPAKNAKDTLVSASGIFANVAPIASGKYVLLVKDRTGKEFKKDVTGFITILNKLTNQQLTSRLSKATPDRGLEKHFAKGYSIKFDGLKSGDPVPTSYTQIYSNISSGYWKNVKVTSVEFNDYNKIKRIRLSVYYN